MKSGPWTAKEDALLRRIYPTTETPQVIVRMQRSKSSVKNRIATLRLRKRVGKRAWQPRDDALLRTLYPNTSTTAIARRMKRGVSGIYGRVTKLGLEKDSEFIRETGRKNAMHPKVIAAQFPKGHVPANKGVKHRRGWGPGRMKTTQFKKGQLPHTWMPVGAHRDVGGYDYTKVSDVRHVPWTRNWKPTHVLLWEKKRGQVPRGHVLAFKNGDRADIRLGNLVLRSMADNMRRNTIHNLPKPIKGAIYALNAVKAQITRITKRKAS